MKFEEADVELHHFCIKIREVVLEHSRSSFAVNGCKVHHGFVEEWHMVGTT